MKKTEKKKGYRKKKREKKKKEKEKKKQTFVSLSLSKKIDISLDNYDDYYYTYCRLYLLLVDHQLFIHETPQPGAPPLCLLTMTIASDQTKAQDLPSMSRSQTRKSPANPSAASPPKKRRKRTVVSGAAEDCFSCAKRGTSCDRRRPYCSRCLDEGQECAGYRTTLTWGVGVASRGKLRGLSLPVTGAKPTSPSPTREGTSLSVREPSTVAEQPGWDVQNGKVWMHHHPPPPPTSYSPSSQLDFGGLAPGSPIPGAWSPAPPAPPAPMQWQQGNSNAGPETQRSPLWAPCPSPSYSQMLLSKSVGRTPRLRYLISYYTEVIAPIIVAFDGPSNPFRGHILRLAQESEPLQEAIATLSTSNLRQRKSRQTMSTERTAASRMSCMAHRALTAEDEGQCGYSVTDIALEEQQHRGRAVRALNAELADPNQRLSDSVLATLLMLCLFHVCDTGVAQFHTQFAGVTKLLALRMRTPKCMTDDLKWFIRMFTWFDTMTATTNDRESHLRGICLDITSVSDGDWGLEDMAGCDPGLFRLVAQLGRLNLSSQRQAPPGSLSSAVPELGTPLAVSPPSSIPGGGVPVVDNTCGLPLPTPPRTADETTTTTTPSPRLSSPAFWTEWFSLRQKLEAWQYLPPGSISFPTGSGTNTAAYISPPSSPSSACVVVPQQYEEIRHVSEAFRHAAILYSERLAYPELPSCHVRIQNHVQMAMQHITAVQSDAYLLWPLFIAGSESVLASQHEMIRQRCRDLSRDSGFYNNLSCLELLEKIWAESGVGSGLDSGFRWQQAMRDKRADGEYMVV